MDSAEREIHELILATLTQGDPIIAEVDDSRERISELDLAKRRAFEVLDEGDVREAWCCFFIALYQSEWRDQYRTPVMLGQQLLRRGRLDTPERMRKFIEDFN